MCKRQLHKVCRYITPILGYGNYTALDVSQLPPLFLVYCPNPSDSGRIHSDVKQKWLAGDTKIVEGMQHFRDITTRARTAIEACNWNDLHQLMTENFEQRRKLYGGNLCEDIYLNLFLNSLLRLLNWLRRGNHVRLC